MHAFTFSAAPITEHLQHEKQCQVISSNRLAGLLRSHHIGIPRWWSVFQLPIVQKHRRAKLRPEGIHNQPVGTRSGAQGFFPGLLKPARPYSPLPSPHQSSGSFIRPITGNRASSSTLKSARSDCSLRLWQCF